MKFKQYLALIADADGFVPTPRLRQIIRKNPRKTAREEAIAAKIIEAAHPRENLTGHYGWGAEEQLVLQQLWMNPGVINFVGDDIENRLVEWRDVPVAGDKDLYSVEQTKYGDLPVPNAVKEPGQVKGDFWERLGEIIGDAE